MVQTATPQTLAPATAVTKQRKARQPKTQPLRLFWARRESATHLVTELNTKGAFLSTHRLVHWSHRETSGAICQCGHYFNRGEGRAHCCPHLLAAMAFEKRQLADSLTRRRENARAFDLNLLAQDYERDGEFRLIRPELVSAAQGCVSVKVPSFSGGDKPYIVDFNQHGVGDCGCPSYYSDNGSPRGMCKHIPFARAVLEAHGITAGGAR